MSAISQTSPCSLPRCEPGKIWLTPQQFAPVVGRAYRTVLRWCSDGTVLEFGYVAYQDPLGRWFLKVPKTIITT